MNKTSPFILFCFPFSYKNTMARWNIAWRTRYICHGCAMLELETAEILDSKITYLLKFLIPNSSPKQFQIWFLENKFRHTKFQKSCEIFGGLIFSLYNSFGNTGSSGLGLSWQNKLFFHGRKLLAMGVGHEIDSHDIRHLHLHRTKNQSYDNFFSIFSPWI